MLANFIHQYGYLAIFIGTFLEGETILALAGFAAHQGYLEFQFVVLSAFLGSLFGDQLYFFLGRKYGTKILTKRPKWQPRKEKFDKLFHKYHTFIIVVFRFLYGLRTVAPFAIGMSSVSTVRFIVLNVIGAIVWAIGLTYLGYLFGDGIAIVLHDIKRYELKIFALMAVVATVFWLHNLFRREEPQKK